MDTFLFPENHRVSQVEPVEPDSCIAKVWALELKEFSESLSMFFSNHGIKSNYQETGSDIAKSAQSIKILKSAKKKLFTGKNTNSSTKPFSFIDS